MSVTSDVSQREYNAAVASREAHRVAVANAIIRPFTRRNIGSKRKEKMDNTHVITLGCGHERSAAMVVRCVHVCALAFVLAVEQRLWNAFVAVHARPMQRRVRHNFYSRQVRAEAEHSAKHSEGCLSPWPAPAVLNFVVSQTRNESVLA